MHDMSLTERHAVIYDLPVTFNLEMAACRRDFPYAWDDDYRRPRRGAARGRARRRRPLVRRSSRATCSIRSTRTTTATASCSTSSATRGCSTDEPARPERGPADALALDGRPVGRQGARGAARRPGRGVPARRRAGRRPPHRFGYGVAVVEDDDDTRLRRQRHAQARPGDRHDRGPRVRRRAPPAKFVFVPRVADAAEDDGWVMGFVYDRRPRRAATSCSSTPDHRRPTVASVHLPVRVPIRLPRQLGAIASDEVSLPVPVRNVVIRVECAKRHPQGPLGRSCWTRCSPAAAMRQPPQPTLRRFLVPDGRGLLLGDLFDALGDLLGGRDRARPTASP